MDKKIMSIVMPDGSIDEVEVILSFEFNDTKKEYVVYTKNETDENGNITIYVASLMKKENDEYALGSIETDAEWTRIKEVLRELSKPEDK